MNDLYGMEQHQTSAVRPVHGMGRRMVLWTIIVVTVGAILILLSGGRVF
ncbi:MAG TPA: hypothetical protein VD862_04450 [Candidatus Paceibacterota bacterium]|nr:hypothetical protein [Candidatus Paceibacterota bacterium]